MDFNPALIMITDIHGVNKFSIIVDVYNTFNFWTLWQGCIFHLIYDVRKR